LKDSEYELDDVIRENRVDFCRGCISQYGSKHVVGTERHDARERDMSRNDRDEDEREEISHTRHVSAEAPVDPLNVIIRPVAPAEFSHVRP